MLPGDGVGRDVGIEARKVLEAAAERWELPIEIEPFPWSADHYLETGVTLPEGAVANFQENYAAIFIGAFGDPRVPDMRHAADILLGLRFQLDLFINLRPVRLWDERLCPLKDKGVSDIDFVVFRENTEGAYVGAGGNFKKGTPDEVAIQEEIHTRLGVERILRAAFDYAVEHNRRQVCMTDKSNAQRFVGDLWLRTFEEISRDYPQIETRHLYVDALAMLLVREPENFDVIVANNMFGDIITDLGAALQGGMGVAASANLHPGRVSMFEPVHGSAPPLAGTGRANPVGAVQSIAMMLSYLGHRPASEVIEGAIAESLRRGETTPDLGGSLTTTQVGDRLARAVATLPEG
jgi:3-isopropylmalate dehydrogenase